MTLDDQASAPCLVRKATFAANLPSRVMGRDWLHGAAAPQAGRIGPNCCFFFYWS